MDDALSRPVAFKQIVSYKDMTHRCAKVNARLTFYGEGLVRAQGSDRV